ncbi:helix-turn-helix domain-containing protein [Planobispora rosea]|uniref:helix-turn-helix domain-containing protein n=1 Tax=Planobispora rosea TaxID=35762 RepID=UPI000A9EFE25|nr:helix-turn-helix domain-containing protein [Planobispora rosea]
MLIMGDDVAFDSIALVVFFRLIWRYRSELAPVGLALSAETTAVALHILRPTWWLCIAVTTALATVTVAVFGRHLGLVRGIERAYAAYLVALIGGWLATATTIGPGKSPLPAILIIGGIVSAIPWWAHRRRRAKVRVERKLAAWPDVAEQVGLAGSRIQSALVDLWGYRFRLALSRGQTVEDAIAKIGNIESALGARRGGARIQPVPEQRADRADVRIVETDPHADAITWAGPSITSITQPVELGLWEDGSAVLVSLLRRHALFGGVAGAGKSGGVNVVMGNLSAAADVIVWGIDLKRGMELQPWASCLGRIATTPQEASELLRDAVAILDGRAEWMATNGLRVWEPTPDAPALLIIIDEYAELVEDAPEAVAYADSIARRGRAPAVTLLVATQRPSQRAMGHSAVRSQMDVRLSFRVRERGDADLILGAGMHKAGWHADKLDAPGKFLLSAPEHDIPRRARAYLMTDETVQHTAVRHAERRPPLDPISAVALRDGPRAADELDATEPAIMRPTGRHARKDAQQRAEDALWSALAEAPDEGATLDELITATGMSRPTIYRRLSALEGQNRVRQVSRGRWRAAHPDESDADPE